MRTGTEMVKQPSASNFHFQFSSTSSVIGTRKHRWPWQLQNRPEDVINAVFRRRFGRRMSIYDSLKPTSSSPCIPCSSTAAHGKFLFRFLYRTKYLGSHFLFQTTWAVFLPLSNEWQQAIFKSCYNWVLLSHLQMSFCFLSRPNGVHFVPLRAQAFYNRKPMWKNRELNFEKK